MFSWEREGGTLQAAHPLQSFSAIHTLAAWLSSGKTVLSPVGGLVSCDQPQIPDRDMAPVTARLVTLNRLHQSKLTLVIRHWTMNIRHWTLDIRHWALDIGHWTLDNGLYQSQLTLGPK